MKKTILLLILILTLFFSGILQAEPYKPKDYVTYFGTSDNELTCHWNLVNGATHYIVELYHVERKAVVMRAIVDSPNQTLTFKVPRTGHYILRVQCKNANGESPWCESTDSGCAKVGGQPRGFWIYGYPAPVGGSITIN